MSQAAGSPATAPAQSRAEGKRPLLHRVASTPEAGIGTALLLLVVIGSVTTDGFLAVDNFLNVGRQVSLLGIMAVGMTFVIVSGEIDLSVGSVYALGAIVTGMLLQGGWSLGLAIAGGVGAGLAVGLVNGLATTKLRVPSFIVSLGTLSAARGLALIVSRGEPISLTGQATQLEMFSLIGRGKLYGLIPMQLVFMAIVFAIGALILQRSILGLRVFAVGGNQEAARLTGIDIDRVKTFGFVLTGALAAFAGILALSFLSYVQGVTGQGIELRVIAAVIIGGTALSGGSGSIWRTLIGVFIIGVLENLLVLRGISSFWQTFLIGVVIVIAAAIDRWIGKSRTRAARGGTSAQSETSPVVNQEVRQEVRAKGG